MARTVDQDKHEAVIYAAFEALRGRGVVGVSMADIATDLGMSRSALYWYFKGLPELFVAVLDLVLARQGAAVAAAVAEVSHPIDALAAWMRATAGFYAADPDLLAVLVQLWATAQPGSKDETLAEFRQRFAPLFEAAVAELQRGVDAGLVAPCEPAMLVDLCAAALDGALVHQLSRGVDAQALVEAFVASVLLPLRRDKTQQTVEPSATGAGKRSPRQDWLSWD